MNIVCATDGNYLPHCAAMLTSLISRQAEAQAPRVYLLINNIGESEYKELIPYLYQLLPSISVLSTTLNHLDEFPVSGHITRSAYIRLLLPDILPHGCKKVLFIDSDTIIADDLNDLWNLPLNGKALAAVPEHWLSCSDHGYRHGHYFNSGVMLIDLDRWRQADVLTRGAIFAKAHPDRLRHWDQDVLNHVFEDDWLPIGDRWNACPHLFGLLPEFSLAPEDLTEAEREAIAHPAIVHFAGPGAVKPWNARCSHPLRHHYLEARSKTPWADVPLDDAPPPQLKRLWDGALFRAKCGLRQILP